MASLELVVDASGVVRGAGEVRTGLAELIDNAYEAEAATGKLSQTLSVTGASAREAWGAGKGGLEIARGLSATATATVAAAAGARDFSGALLAAANLASQFGRTKDEWRNLATAMATTRTVSQEIVRDQFGIATGVRNVVNVQQSAVTGWGALWAVIKANPLTALVTGLSAAGAAISLFADNTGKLAGEWENLGRVMSRVPAEANVAERFGDANLAGEANKRRVSALFEAAVTARASNQPIGLTQFFDSALPNTSFRSFLQRTSGLPGRENLWGPNEWNQFNDEQLRLFFQQGNVQLRPDEQIEILRRMAQPFQSAARSQEGPIGPPLPPPAPPAYEGIGPFLPGTSQEAMARAGTIKLNDERRAESLRESARELERMQRTAEQIGSTLGDAAFDFASGLRSGREVLQSLLSDFGRGLARQGMASLASQIVTSFAGGKQTIRTPGGGP